MELPYEKRKDGYQVWSEPLNMPFGIPGNNATICLITGDTGSGKTTLFNKILGNYPDDFCLQHPRYPNGITLDNCRENVTNKPQNAQKNYKFEKLRIVELFEPDKSTASMGAHFA